ncbi:MAG TPA: hypothetical protein VLJ41_17540 [Segetibacter sp.]|nr:hypothetical protein [Segetibacter sp.]
MKQFLPANVVITFCCLAIVVILQYILQAFLSTQNMFVSRWISLYTILSALIILVVLWIVNLTTIRKYIGETKK